MSRLQREFDTLREREEAQLVALRRLEEQLHEAATVQRDLLPAVLPELHGAEIGVFHRPAETLGGDAYDVFRLDEHRIALVLSDATGHGVPAALLSSYVQRGLRGGGSSPPDEVLRDVNADLLGRRLSDCQFVAALYAVYDERNGTLRLARGGTPYPVLARPGDPPRVIVSAGPLVGACESPTFDVLEISLQVGDTLFLHTDGLETAAALSLPSAGQRDGAHQARVAQTVATRTDELPWISECAQGEIAAAVESLRAQTESLAAQNATLDDITVLVLRRTG